MTISIEHAYSPEQYTRVTELWRELLDVHTVGHDYRAYPYDGKITDEHLAELIMSDGAETRNYGPVEVTLASYSDYHGSDYDAANIVEIEESHDWVTVRGYRFDEESAWVQLGELPPNDEDIDDGIAKLELLVRDIQGLDEYPLINDEKHSEYVDALAEKCWESGWGLSDTVREAVEAEIGGDLDDFGVTNEEIRDAYFGHENTYWYAEAATSVVNGEHESVTKDIAQTIAAETIAAWRKPVYDAAQLTL